MRKKTQIFFIAFCWAFSCANCMCIVPSVSGAEWQNNRHRCEDGEWIHSREKNLLHILYHAPFALNSFNVLSFFFLFSRFSSLSLFFSDSFVYWVRFFVFVLFSISHSLALVFASIYSIYLSSLLNTKHCVPFVLLHYLLPVPIFAWQANFISFSCFPRCIFFSFLFFVALFLFLCLSALLLLFVFLSLSFSVNIFKAAVLARLVVPDTGSSVLTAHCVILLVAFSFFHCLMTLVGIYC